MVNNFMGDKLIIIRISTMNNNTNADVIQLLYRAKKRMSISEQARQQFQYDTIVQQAQGFYSMEKWDLINEQGYTRQTQKHIYIYILFSEWNYNEIYRE